VYNTFDGDHNPALLAAQQYDNIGLTPIPITANTKIPHLRSWPTLKPRTLLKQFRPDDNVGLRMGRQANGTVIFTIDVDTKHNGQLSKLTQNRAWIITAEAITPSGGRHYLFMLPAGLTCRTRIGLIQGIDVIGQGGLIAVEPSNIDDRAYVWVRHPTQGIATAPQWLVADLQRAGVVGKTGPKRARRAAPARNTAAVPQSPRRKQEGHRRPKEQPGLLAELLWRFPVTGSGQRNRQLHRLICSLVCAGYSDSEIQDAAFGWWSHVHSQQLCDHAPDPRQIQRQLRSDRRAFALGKIQPRDVVQCHTEQPAPPFLVFKPAPVSGQGLRQWVKLGPTERAFVAGLLAHFSSEALLVHPLDPDLPATNDQLINMITRACGSGIAGKELRDLKRKFISRPGKPATKLEILVCVREGFRTSSLRVPSYYQLTPIFVQLWEQFAQTGS
jgi:bifunctional DNA primase/polymerase-like protein